MGLVSRIDGYQRRHRVIGIPLAVVYKFFDDQGNYLAAIITYYGFLSLFPLLLLFVTILGFLLRGHPHLQHQLLHSALAQFPIVGNELQRSTHSITGGATGLVVGIVGALYGGLGVVQAGQNAFNRAYAVPRQDRPDPLHSRARSLVLLPVLGLGVAFTTVLSGFTTSAASVLGGGAKVGGTILSVLLNIVIFAAAYRLLTAVRLSNRDVAAGAVIAGVAWQVLQSVGTLVIRHKLKGAGATAGTFGVVLGLLAWIYVEAIITVLCAEINVVVRRRLWPRALLALVSDTEDLTSGDRAVYSSYSRSERYKSFHDITVRFLPKAAGPDRGAVPGGKGRRRRPPGRPPARPPGRGVSP
ncbi:MAG: YihY/virulence factor BrkB family protein [Acidimicrobiales bacterium]